MMNKFGPQLGDYLEFYNISVNDFAERINVTPKHLIDIIKGNAPITENMIYNLSFITGISASYIANVENSNRTRNIIDKYMKEKNINITEFINQFNYKEFSKEYDFQYTDIRDKYEIAEDILKYLRITDPHILYKEDNTILYKSRNDKPELLALWLERCYRMVQGQELGEYKKENIEVLVSFIKEEARNNRFDKERLKKEFNKNGIFLAIEPDLKGSKIRGAFKVLNKKPAVYLTTKHKRIGDVYFALLHELAHCKSDFNRAKNGSIVSNTFEGPASDYEIKADKTALNWMVNEKDYSIIKESKDINYNNNIPSFVVYRLALDGIIKYNSKKYQDNNIKITI